MKVLTEEQQRIIMSSKLGVATREELVWLAKSLKADGLNYAEIALVMGRGVRTIQVYLKEP